MTNVDDTVQLAGTAVCCLSENLLTATLDAESKSLMRELNSYSSFQAKISECYTFYCFFKVFSKLFKTLPLPYDR